jgi:hypothetical protein
VIDFTIDPTGTKISVHIDQELRRRASSQYAEFGELIRTLRSRGILSFDDAAMFRVELEPSVSVLYHISQKRITTSNPHAYLEELSTLITSNRVGTTEIRQSALYLPLLTGSTNFRPIDLSSQQIEFLEARLSRIHTQLGAEWSDFVSPIRAITVVEVPGHEDLPYFSGSSSEIWGAIHICLPADDGVMAELLTHEAGHHWVHLVEDLGPLATDCWEGEMWPSPWRNELRPLGGVIHGTFVFAAAAAALCCLMLRYGEDHSVVRETLRRRIAYLMAQVEYGKAVCVESGLLLANGIELIAAVGRTLTEVSPYVTDDTLTAAKQALDLRMQRKFAAWREQGLHWHVP